MSAQQLIGEFDRLAEAPGAVPVLRQFAFDLASRGKLTEQNEADGSARAEVREIQKECARLVAAGKVPKPRKVPAANPDAEPFEIPSNWVWVRLSDISSYIQRGKSPKYAANGGPLVVGQRCVRWEGLDLSVARTITEDSLAAYEEYRFLRRGDLLWNSTGTGSIGRVSRVVDPPPNLVCDSHVTVVRCLGVEPEYVRIWLRSDHVFGTIEERASGATNQVELTAGMANNQRVPLPPLAEQRRIVAKVGELMALCDRLEAAQAERERRRDRLAAAVVRETALTREQSIHRLMLKELPRLTARSDHVRAISGLVVDLGLTGALHSPDESIPAVALACSTDTPRRARIGGRGAGVGPVRPEEVQFAAPTNWQWTRLEATCIAPIVYGIIQPGPDAPGGVPYVRPAEIRNGRIDESGLKRTTSEIAARYERAALLPGDVILTIVGTIGATAVVPPSLHGANITQSSCRLRVNPEVLDRDFLLLFLSSGWAQRQYEQLRFGTAVERLNIAHVRGLVIPVPPLAEQRKIVALVSEMSQLAKSLERTTQYTSETQARLLHTVLAEALELDSR